MKLLDVRHSTAYRYARPVALGQHRPMLRPRDSYDLRLVAAEHLIRVAVTRDPSQAVPIAGSYEGSAADFLGITVAVTVSAAAD